MAFKYESGEMNAAWKLWADSWDPFLMDSDQKKTFHDHGYYSAPFTYSDGTQVGEKYTKVISLNTNFCYQFNYEVAQ
jgi:hypothetical protein